jgi:hypothetical protein
MWVSSADLGQAGAARQRVGSSSQLVRNCLKRGYRFKWTRAPALHAASLGILMTQ